MATERKSTRSKARSGSSSNGAKKSAAGRAKSAKKTSTTNAGAAKKTGASAATRAKKTRTSAGANGTGKTTPKRSSKAATATRKKPTVATAETKQQLAKPAEAADWSADAAKKPAKQVAAESTTASLRPGRRRGWGMPLAIGLLAVGAVVVIILIISGGDDKNASVQTPAAPAAPAPPPPAAAPAAPPAAAPATKPAQQVQRCDPIFGGGVSHDVTSSAKGGSSPASCGEAHSVLLTALNSKAATVGNWRCVAQPSAGTLASCTSGDRTIVARN